MIDLSKYPRVKKFLEEHPGMSLDQALELTEKKLDELNKIKGAGAREKNTQKEILREGNKYDRRPL